MRHTWEDLVDVFRLAKRDLEVQRDQKTGKIKAARSYGNLLDYYHKRGWIDDDQHASGFRLAELWYYGFEKSNHTGSRFEPFSGKHVKIPEFNDSGRRFIRAVMAIEPRASASLVVRVCCRNEPAGARQQMIRFKHGLDDLTRHFLKRR